MPSALKSGSSSSILHWKNLSGFLGVVEMVFYRLGFFLPNQSLTRLLLHRAGALVFYTLPFSLLIVFFWGGFLDEGIRRRRWFSNSHPPRIYLRSYSRL